jgi:hypothetical protein
MSFFELFDPPEQPGGEPEEPTPVETGTGSGAPEVAQIEPGNDAAPADGDAVAAVDAAPVDPAAAPADGTEGAPEADSEEEEEEREDLERGTIDQLGDLFEGLDLESIFGEFLVSIQDFLDMISEYLGVEGEEDPDSPETTPDTITAARELLEGDNLVEQLTRRTNNNVLTGGNFDGDDATAQLQLDRLKTEGITTVVTIGTPDAILSDTANSDIISITIPGTLAEAEEIDYNELSGLYEKYKAGNLAILGNDSAAISTLMYAVHNPGITADQLNTATGETLAGTNAMIDDFIANQATIRTANTWMPQMPAAATDDAEDEPGDGEPAAG